MITQTYAPMCSDSYINAALFWQYLLRVVVQHLRQKAKEDKLPVDICMYIYISYTYLPHALNNHIYSDIQLSWHFTACFGSERYLPMQAEKVINKRYYWEQENDVNWEGIPKYALRKNIIFSTIRDLFYSFILSILMMKTWINRIIDSFICNILYWYKAMFRE